MAELTRNQRLTIGFVFTAVGVAFAVWAFYRGCLQGVQPQIVQALLPLAAGFAAWSFSGTIKLDAKDLGLLPRTMIVATGGFAVWLATAYILIPRSDKACDKESAREQLLAAVSGIRTMRGDYAYVLAGDRTAAAKVLNRGPGLILELENIDAGKLTGAERIFRDANIGRGYLYMALVWEMAEQNKAKAIDIAGQSLSWAGRAKSEMDTYLKGYAPTLAQDADQYARQRLWLTQENLDQFIYQMIGRAHLVAYKAGSSSYADAVEAFRKVSSAYRKSEGLDEEPLLKWFCKQHPSEEAICS